MFSILRVCVKFHCFYKFAPSRTPLDCLVEQEAKLFKKQWVYYFFNILFYFLFVGQLKRAEVYLPGKRKIRCYKKEAANTTEEQLPMADFYF